MRGPFLTNEAAFHCTVCRLDFQGSSKAHRTPQSARRSAGRSASSPANPFQRPSKSDVASAFRLCVMAVKKKRELFPGHSPTSRGWFVLPRARRVVKSSLFPRPGPGILTWFPFDRVRFWTMPRSTALILIVWRNRSYPTSQDRLTHVQMLFTWNPSPLQSSKISFEYLLLPPRSALMDVPTAFTR